MELEKEELPEAEKKDQELFPHLVDTRPKVLLVEDHPANVIVATAFLDQFGYAYDVASNGVEALEKVKTTTYALVLMDVQMHGMNGLEATRLIRLYEQRNNKKHLPVIGMTAHAMAGDRERCLGVGMDDYIAKPFDPDHLKQKIDSYAATQKKVA
jgi:CheY-like chemotaxis protein